MFDAVVDGTDVSKAKPDPEVFLIAAKLLNIEPENCIVFEDSVAGVQAANTAKMISIGIGSEEVLGEAEKELSGAENDTTNNRMELKAIVEGVKALNEPCKIRFTSDSTYVVKGINEWLSGWVQNDWKNSAKKPVKNSDLWQEFLEAMENGKHEIEAVWVKGHAGHEENERCDKLARGEAERLKASL